MTRVDFYVLPDKDERSRWQTVCRIAEKAFKHGQAVHVHTGDKAIAGELDRFMWTWRDGSFLPHALFDDQHVDANPDVVKIRIGYGQEPLPDTELLINLHSAVPEFFSRLDRVMEIVGGDDATRAAARDRFKFYRDRGYDLNTHKL